MYVLPSRKLPSQWAHAFWAFYAKCADFFLPQTKIRGPMRQTVEIKMGFLSNTESQWMVTLTFLIWETNERWSTKEQVWETLKADPAAALLSACLPLGAFLSRMHVS